MKIIKRQTLQGHPVPDKVTEPRGPFPSEVLAEPEIVHYYEQAYAEDGSNFLPGATVQNNFKPKRYLRCSICLARVLEEETQFHVCDEVEDE